jgi:hypothetical protein
MVRDSLEIGQKVYEIEQTADGEQIDTTSPMRVVQTPTKAAEDFVIEGLGRTVYDLNRDHPADDEVVGIAFESSMDAPTREPWKPNNATVYHYPRSRLISADDVIARFAPEGATT